MKRKNIIFIALAFIIVILISSWLYFSGGTIKVDNYLNNLVNPIDRNCSVSSDCKLATTNCDFIGCMLDAVNKNWEPFCPIPRLVGACAQFQTNQKEECINNTCVVTHPNLRY